MGAKGLTERHEAFVREYLVDLNATQAAIRAGYSAKTAKQQGSRLLTNADVRAAVEGAQKVRAQRTEVTAEYVLTNLQEVLERCMQRAPVMVRVGRHMEQAVDDEGRHVWEFNANGANKSLELLGKHLAMWVERHEVKTDGSFAEALRLARERAQLAKIPSGAGPTESTVSSEGADLGPNGEAP